MKNTDSKTRRLRFGSVWDRLFTLATFLLFFYLIYLAYIGRFDAEVNRFADFLRRLFT